MNVDDVLSVTCRSRPGKLFYAVAAWNNRFGEKKAGGKLFVVTRRAHRCRHCLIADADLERLFNREIIALIFKGAVLPSADDLSGSDSVLFHRFDPNDIISGRGNLSSLHLAGT